MRELIVNIWIFIDLDTEIAYNWSGRVYSIEGNDDKKLDFLRIASSTDYLVCERKTFPENIKTILPYEELRGCLPSNMIKSLLENNPDLFFCELERSLPPMLNLNINDLKPTPQKISNNPLYVLTQIYEDESGMQHPIISENDLYWLNVERLKRGRFN